MTEQEYLDQRVNDQINWYDRKAGIHKKWFISLKIFEILLALLIPFLTGYMTAEGPELKFIVGLIGILIAAIAGIITLSKFQENWIQYRTVSESLKHEKFLFLAKAGPYKDNDAFQLFVERFESYISKENTQWASYIKSASGEADKK